MRKITHSLIVAVAMLTLGTATDTSSARCNCKVHRHKSHTHECTGAHDCSGPAPSRRPNCTCHDGANGTGTTDTVTAPNVRNKELEPEEIDIPQPVDQIDEPSVEIENPSVEIENGVSVQESIEASAEELDAGPIEEHPTTAADVENESAKEGDAQEAVIKENPFQKGTADDGPSQPPSGVQPIKSESSETSSANSPNVTTSPADRVPETKDVSPSPSDAKKKESSATEKTLDAGNKKRPFDLPTLEKVPDPPVPNTTKVHLRELPVKFDSYGYLRIPSAAPSPSGTGTGSRSRLHTASRSEVTWSTTGNVVK